MARLTVLLVLWFAALSGLILDPAWPSTSPLPLVTLELRYPLPAAGQVILYWGVDGWRPVPEDMRPPDTVVRHEIMSTPMALKDAYFVTTLLVEVGARVDYGFSVRKTVAGAPVEVWDGDDSYHVTPRQSQIHVAKSVKFYQNRRILMDRAGLIMAGTMAAIFLGLLLVAGWLAWSKSALRSASEPLSVGDGRLAVLVSLSAFILGLMVIVHHEMWRDELQAWRIATSSHNLAEWFRHSRYEGHPPLWYLCLYLLSRLSDDPIVMQIFHLTVGVTTIFLLCRDAPFTKWQKVLLSFGYFPFFEYLAVSRNYALGFLALIAFCALHTRRPRWTVSGAILLAVMMNTSAFGAIIGVTMGGWLFIDCLSRHRAVDRVAIASGTLLVLLLGLAIAGMQSAPPPDTSPRMLSWNTALIGVSVEKTFNALWTSYVPLPKTLPHFWNTNILDSLPSLRLGNYTAEARDVQAVLSLVLLTIAAVILSRTPSIMMVYVVTTGGLLLFMQLKVNHGIRHTGHLFLLLLACLWLSRSHRPVGKTGFRARAAAVFVTVLFAGHAVAGCIAAGTDLVYPFSASKETAQFIERQGLAGTPMVGSKYDLASAVAGYLNRPVYYIENKQLGTFVRWQDRRTKVSPADAVRQARELAELNRTDILLIVSYDLAAAGTGLTELASFQRSIIPEEHYWLYLLPYRNADGRHDT